ncbi:GNAT family N-acetyltransferase [Sphingomonas sp. R647]|uniref:GNAT family N-acetyltransferase n=1 Tax=Sphingomonas sp. R647 TaxID=2875233 RepID=UPI001CD597EE|nr:GNAT family N-acetyltransferase [Sphingomonas sp. R647]MCA1199703.1 GNAT family N-acetyltransferase [Sphingomonas sp. R647]
MSWRAMTVADLPAVTAISAAVHGRYGEPVEVYAERLALWPSGCFVWQQGDAIAGLLVAHPWHRVTSPELGALLGTIPQDADSFYLHDIALLPETRGQGAGKAATALVIDRARSAGYSDITLVAVNGAEAFWTTQGFAITEAGGYGPGTYRMHRTVD